MTAPFEFTRGRLVAFDDAQEGPQTGRLLGTIPLCSDKPHAGVVQVHHPRKLTGMLWTVPLIDLHLLHLQICPSPVIDFANEPGARRFAIFTTSPADLQGNVATILDHE